MRGLVKVAAATAFNEAVKKKTKRAARDPPNISELMEQGFRALEKKEKGRGRVPLGVVTEAIRAMELSLDKRKGRCRTTSLEMISLPNVHH